MLILASLSGIQHFLFDVRESGGGQAKSLRHRSFRIQLIAECVALRLLDAAGLPYDRLLFCAAAKICIDASGLSAAGADAVRHVAADMERMLLDDTHGRLRLSVVLRKSSGAFADDFDRANRALELAKMRPFRSAAVAADGTWSDGSLVVRDRWDADAEAKRDAGIGSQLASARWLTIRRADGARVGDEMDTIGLRVWLERDEPKPSPTLLSYSNLADPDTPARSVDRRLFHRRRLARQVPHGRHGEPVEFVELAGRARGAPMLGVLKADVDSLGAAVSAVLRNGRGLQSLRHLSDRLDGFFAETLEAEKRRADSRWADIYTVFSGGDDMLAVGPWDVMLDFAAHARTLFSTRFGPDARQSPSPTPLTISTGVAIIKPKYPIHLAAQQAEELLQRAKAEAAPRAKQPKDQCAALGGLWKGNDHDAIIGAGKQLTDWVDAGIIQRGWLHTLLELALLRRGQAGPEYAGIHPAVATSRLAYHVARNWSRKRNNPRDHHQRAQNDARAWIDAVLREFDQFTTTTHVETIHLPAIVRYAMLATRSGTSEDVK